MSRESDLGWAAGIIDGEGCIQLYRTTGTRGVGWVLRVMVNNTSLVMLNRLQEVFGDGTIRPHRIPTNPRHRPTWSWSVAAKKAETALRLIEPYLVNKREEARVGLHSRSLIRQHGINTANPNDEQLRWLKGQLSTLKRA